MTSRYPHVHAQLEVLQAAEATTYARELIRNRGIADPDVLLDRTKSYLYGGKRRTRELKAWPAALVINLLVLRAAKVEPAEYPRQVRTALRAAQAKTEAEVTVRIGAWRRSEPQRQRASLRSGSAGK